MGNWGDAGREGQVLRVLEYKAKNLGLPPEGAREP